MLADGRNSSYSGATHPFASTVFPRTPFGFSKRQCLRGTHPREFCFSVVLLDGRSYAPVFVPSQNLTSDTALFPPTGRASCLFTQQDSIHGRASGVPIKQCSPLPWRRWHLWSASYRRHFFPDGSSPQLSALAPVFSVHKTSPFMVQVPDEPVLVVY